MTPPDHANALSQLLGSLRHDNAHAAACRRIVAACAEMQYADRTIRLHSFHLSHGPLPPTHGTARVSMAMHRHSCYEALLILRGTAVETQGSRRSIEPGMLQINTPGLPHGWQASQRTLVRLGISFSLDPDVPPRDLARWPVCSAAFTDLQSLLEEAGNRTPGSRDRVRARFLLFLARFLALLEWPAATAQDEPEDSDGNLALTVDRFMDDNLDHALTLADVAIIARMSVPTLTRRYRAETGESVMAHLLELRMQMGATLLRTTTLPVKAVAARVGYTEPTYFCRCFRRRFGCSPLQYRSANTASPSPYARDPAARR